MGGYIYLGFQNRRTKNGTFKIGETGKTPAIRENQIKRSECFSMIEWFYLPYADKPTLLLVEAIVRYHFAQNPEYTHTGLDHFRYDIKNRLEDIDNIKNDFIDIVKKTCQQYGIEYAHS